MAIHVAWDAEDSRVIHHSMEDPWDWTQFYDAIEQIKHLSLQTTQDVALIVDLAHTRSMPPSAISHYIRMAELLHKYIDISVVSNGSRFYGSMFRMFKKLSKGPISESYYWASSNEEALEIIRAYRQQKLPSL